jgi:hypothetical protein
MSSRLTPISAYPRSPVFIGCQWTDRLNGGQAMRLHADPLRQSALCYFNRDV